MADADAEVARADLLELFPGGFEEVERDDGVELVVYTDEEGEATIRAVFGDVSTTPVEPGWESRWRAFHHAVVVAGLWIGPPWERPPANATSVVVDPGRAFGTGAHPTTRACITLLAELERGSLLDAGCGSGVVAVAAARLGFEPVFAVDLDPVAVEAAAETARRNDVRVDVRLADVAKDDLPEVDVVVANIELGVAEALLGRGPARVVVTSGYLRGETPRVPGWEVVSGVELDGWAAHVVLAK